MGGKNKKNNSPKRKKNKQTKQNPASHQSENISKVGNDVVFFYRVLPSFPDALARPRRRRYRVVSTEFLLFLPEHTRPSMRWPYLHRRR